MSDCKTFSNKNNRVLRVRPNQVLRHILLACMHDIFDPHMDDVWSHYDQIPCCTDHKNRIVLENQRKMCKCHSDQSQSRRVSGARGEWYWLLLGLQIPSRRGRKLPSLLIGSLVLGSLEMFSILRARMPPKVPSHLHRVNEPSVIEQSRIFLHSCNQFSVDTPYLYGSMLLRHKWLLHNTIRLNL